MRTHTPDELRTFLASVDVALGQPAGIIVIGGAAAALHYGATRQTSDIDTFHQLSPDLERAVEAARRETGLEIPVSFAAVADTPFNFEDRLQEVTELGLHKLQIYVPERHDLVLMKTIRGYEHDLEVIEQMHGKEALDLDTLVSRFEDEMGHVVADPRKLRLNVRLLADRLFGRAASEALRVRFHRQFPDGLDR